MWQWLSIREHNSLLAQKLFEMLSSDTPFIDERKLREGKDG